MPAHDDLIFGWEPLDDLLAEPNVRELLLLQYEEFGGLREDIPLDPDIGRMREAEKLGVFRLWAARRDGRLVGFIEWHISPTFHHRSTLYAIDGGHFVHPDEGAWTWLRMWRAALAALLELGCRVVLAHDNPHRPLDRAFDRLGFQPAGSLYVRTL